MGLKKSPKEKSSYGLATIAAFVSGKGHRKTIYRRQYQKLREYTERLKTYAEHIEICGDDRHIYKNKYGRTE